MPSLESEKQAEFFMDTIYRKLGRMQKGDQLYETVMTWLRLPLDLSPQIRARVLQAVKDKTGMTEDQLLAELGDVQIQPLNGQASVPVKAPVQTQNESVRDILLAKMAIAREEEAELIAMLPERGFFHDYVQYTINSEAPLAFHFWSAIIGVASTVNRRVYKDMGNHKLFPPFGVFLLGDSGVKKTTAGDILLSLLRELGTVSIYAEKLTPEALIDGMKGGNATGLVYAPEMTVLISRQKYMESIIPLLTRFMDSPDIWNSGTIMRGEAELVDIGISCLMCSTIDWFTKNTPEAVFGGGFIARNVMILQDISPRIFALPPPEDKLLRKRLIVQLANLASVKGEITLSPETKALHESWYMENKVSRIAQSDLFETYFARKPSHLLRIAMCLHLGTCQDLVLCSDCWHRARKVLEWNEHHFDLLNSRMFKSDYGDNQDLVVRTLQRAGGKMHHSELIRRLGYKLPAGQVKVILNNLREMGTVHEHLSTLAHYYELRKENHE